MLSIDLTPSSVLTQLRHDRIGEIAIRHGSYQVVEFGRMGRVLLALQPRDSLPLLAEAMASEAPLLYGGHPVSAVFPIDRVTKPVSSGRSVLECPFGERNLPLRLRDYALLLYCAIFGADSGFGPSTPYEERNTIYYRLWQSL